MSTQDQSPTTGTLAAVCHALSALNKPASNAEAVRPAEVSSRTVYFSVDRHIPAAEIIRALNTFGFQVRYVDGELHVSYEDERPRRTVPPIPGRFEPGEPTREPMRDDEPDDESPSEAMRQKFLRDGVEP